MRGERSNVYLGCAQYDGVSSGDKHGGDWLDVSVEAFDKNERAFRILLDQAEHRDGLLPRISKPAALGVGKLTYSVGSSSDYVPAVLADGHLSQLTPHFHVVPHNLVLRYKPRLAHTE